MDGQPHCIRSFRRGDWNHDVLQRLRGLMTRSDHGSIHVSPMCDRYRSRSGHSRCFLSIPSIAAIDVTMFIRGKCNRDNC
jgi:hypothetical protein